MSKRSKAAAQPSGGAGWVSTLGHSFADSFQNFLTRLGVGANNASSGSTYGFNPVTRNRVLMEQMHRGSWVAGVAVEARAKDMTREGVEIRSDDKPQDLQAIDEEAKRLQIWNSLGETVAWSRLYGGAIGVQLVEGQQFDTPLRPDTVRKGQYKGIKALDRWVVQPTLEDVITEYGPELGRPKYYRVTDSTVGLPAMKVHHSRVIRLEGLQLPHNQRRTENGWGASVCERLWDRLIAFDSTSAGAAQLVYKAHLRTVSVEGLREIVAAGGKLLDGLMAQINMIRTLQSIEGITLLDAKDKFETHQYAFSGLSDVLLQFGQQLAGATETPLVRFFGQSPAGLNSSGESDWRNYYDSIKAEQTSKLYTGVGTTYDLLYRTCDLDPRKTRTLHFKPLWQMTEPERATVTNTMTAAVVAAFAGQLIDRGLALKELHQISEVTGAWSNIDDKMIRDAEAEGPPPSAADILAASNPDAGSGKEGDGNERKDSDQ